MIRELELGGGGDQVVSHRPLLPRAFLGVFLPLQLSPLLDQPVQRHSEQRIVRFQMKVPVPLDLRSRRKRFKSAFKQTNNFTARVRGKLGLLVCCNQVEAASLIPRTVFGIVH